MSKPFFYSFYILLMIFSLLLLFYFILTNNGAIIFEDNLTSKEFIVDSNKFFDYYQKDLSNDIIDFENFDNNPQNMNDTTYYNRTKIVPNIIHLIYTNYTYLKFYEMINIFSIYFNQKPDRIYLHCDNCEFHGKYWDYIQEKLGPKNVIYIHKIPFFKTIFGQNYKWIHHRFIFFLY